MIADLPLVPVDIYIDGGESYSQTLVVKDSSGALVNLTGITVSAKMRRYAGSGEYLPLYASISMPSSIVLNMSNYATEELTSSRYVYEVRLNDGTVTAKVFGGQVLVSSAV